MSRTKRKSRLKPGHIIRDGEVNYVSVHCKNNNACEYCRNNRTFQSRKIKQTITEN